MKWYGLADDQDVADVRYYLGILYAKGQGVPQDCVQAYKWFDLSAAQGNNAAVENRDTVAKRMTAEQIAEAQKLARQWKPGR